MRSWTVQDDLRSRFDQLMVWGREVSSELSRLPTTLAQLREGAANFQLVGQRLAASSAALEELTALYGKTLGQGVKRSADAAKALQVQIDRMGETTPDARCALGGCRGAATDLRVPGGDEPLLAPGRPPRHPLDATLQLGAHPPRVHVLG